MRLPRKRGSTSNMIRVFIPDNTSTTGAGLTGLTNASTNLSIGFSRAFDNGYTAYAGANIETITTIGTYQAPSSSSKVRFKAVDATNSPGEYELHFHDSATVFGSADASPHVTINIIETSTTALHIGPNITMIPLVPWDPQDGVRMGQTALPNAAAAAANGLPVLGTNATAISFTAGMTISNATGDALALTSSGSNGNGLNASGNGTADGIKATGGATGRGIHALGGATSGAGIRAEGQGAGASGMHALGFGASGSGFRFEGGTTTAPGALFVGGSTTGAGISVTTTSGDGLSLTPTAGSGIVATGQGTSMFGAIFTGGTAGTSDGLKAVAGIGGVPIRGDLTGNITGNLSGSVGSVTGAVGSVTGAVGSVTGAVGSVTGNVGGNVVGSTASVTAGVTVTTNNDKTGYSLSGTITTIDAHYLRVNTAQAGAAGSVTLDASASATDSLYNGAWVAILSGTGAGQARLITGYTGSTKVAAITPNWTTNPASGATFAIVPAAYLAGINGNVSGSVGSVTGAVGSVTGAVGSVTGNVGGNVVGSTASVTGAVGSVTGNLGGNVVGNVNGNVSGSVGSVTGAVGSVTGAVGSVTGNVGGNVVGSTASVTGAVGSVTGDVGGKVLGGGSGTISGDGVRAASVTGAVGSVTGAVGSVTATVSINLAQTGLSPRALDAVADGSLMIGDALICAIAAATGKESIVGTAYTIKTPSTGTTIRTFTLDSGTSPTTRT